ncbi:hypothetical protein B0T18DRAFT_128731 [Schizothecium vesticola]|uniref:C2H2-type domain-containing protein n=1 Tax=Schizothecium vesticola TaxID=314040 RepID=A0AA40F3D8_9PEZI|nr:hypothetical protein B0T18DRAFT_128731 [Schizothecium vesticola]
MTRYNRHQQIHSEEDLMKWSHEASRYQDLALCSDLKSTAEESDEDLRNYRQDVETDASGEKADAARSRGGRTPSPITDIEDDNTNRLSQAESAPSPDVDPDARHQDPADRIARELLAQEFAVFLGSSNPPIQVLQAIRKCLDDLSRSVRSARSLGFLPPHTTANPWAESAASVSFSSSSPSGQGSSSWINQRKRPQGYRQNNDDDDIQDDQSEDGSGISPRSDLDHRKKPKVVQYPCPFRKRSPHNFNCREWEFCAKAPFKGMSELKKHIRNYHQRQHQPLAYICRRCHVGFVREEDLESHSLLPSEEMCEVRPGPRPIIELAGITLEMANRLSSRAERFEWDTLWLALFPGDRDVPDPDFEPIVELHEVDHEYRAVLPVFQAQLASFLHASQLRTDALASDIYQDQVMGDNLERMFKELVTTVFKRARSRAAGETPAPPPSLRRAAAPRSPAPVTTPSIRTNPAAIPTTMPPYPIPRPLLPRASGPDRLSTLSFGSATSASSSARYSTLSLAQQSNRTSMTSTASSSAISFSIRPPGPGLMSPAQAPHARKMLRISGQRQPLPLHVPHHSSRTSPLRQSVDMPSPASAASPRGVDSPGQEEDEEQDVMTLESSTTTPGVCSSPLASPATTKNPRHGGGGGGGNKESYRDSAVSPPTGGGDGDAMPCGHWPAALEYGYTYPAYAYPRRDAGADGFYARGGAPLAPHMPFFAAGGGGVAPGFPATTPTDVMLDAENVGVEGWTCASDVQALQMEGPYYPYNDA